MGDVLNQVRAKLELEGRNAADVKRRVVTAFTKIAGKDSFKNSMTQELWGEHANRAFNWRLTPEQLVEIWTYMNPEGDQQLAVSTAVQRFTHGFAAVGATEDTFSQRFIDRSEATRRKSESARKESGAGTMLMSAESAGKINVPAHKFESQQKRSDRFH